MMIYFVLLFTMIFVHIMLDFNQGDIIASMKQKSWWLKHPDYKESYNNDYLVALFVHGLSWAFAIHIPLIIYQLLIDVSEYNDDITLSVCLLSIIVNCIIHAIVDNLKANKLTINLQQDQALHFLQILITWIVFAVVKCRLYFDLV